MTSSTSAPTSSAVVEPVNAVVPPALLQIDPRQAPFVDGSDGLPAVAPAQLTATALRARFASPPVWTPELRREPA